MKRFCCIFFFLLIVIAVGGCSSGSDDPEDNYAIDVEVEGESGSGDIGLGATKTLKVTATEGEPPDEESEAQGVNGLDVSFDFIENNSGATLTTVSNNTQADGTARAYYKAGDTPGVDIVQVRVSDTTSSISLRVAGGSEVVDSLVVTTDSENIEPGDYVDVSVEGKTYNDSPAVGKEISFSMIANNTGGGFVVGNQETQNVTETLDSQGEASITYHTGQSSGRDVIEVASGPGSSEIVETVYFNVGQGTALGSISVEAFKTSNFTDWVKKKKIDDRFGGPASDLLVNFYADNGDIEGGEVATNVNGVAEINLQSQGETEVVAITENVRSEITLSVYEYLENSTISLDIPEQAQSGETIPVRATIVSNDGNPLQGIPVNFYANKGSVGGSEVQTNINGVAETTLSVPDGGITRVWANYGNISQSEIVNVSSGDLSIETSDLADAHAGYEYVAQLEVSGGVEPYTWAFSGDVPDGIVTDESGLISGAPESAGNYSISVQVTDSAENTSSQAFVLDVKDYAPEGDLAIDDETVPEATVDQEFTYQLTASGGVEPYTWQATGGPAGISITSDTGIVSGIPEEEGSFNFVVMVSDSSGLTASKNLPITVASNGTETTELSISTNSLPEANINQSYQVLLEASGGDEPYTWIIQSGSLPNGLSFEGQDGIISGTPTQAGSTSIILQVEDASGETRSKSFSLTISSDPVADLNLVTSSLPDGNLNASYNTILEADGGVTPYSWSVYSGTLPSGLSLGSQDGIISGTPTQSGDFSLILQVEDDNGDKSAKSFTLTVVDTSVPLEIETSSLPDATVNESYSTSLSATGGMSPYSWYGSNLPSGLNMSTDGVLSGTPTSEGQSTISVTLYDDSGESVNKSLSLDVQSQQTTNLQVTTSSLPEATVGIDYGASFEASGGVTPYTWNDETNLPPGLSLSANGIISGTPTTAGTYSFVVSVTDDDGETVNKNTSLTVSAP